MPDPLRQLICDTLAYLKDPLLSKQTIFATKEDALFFQRAPSPQAREKPIQPVPVKVQQRPIPSERPAQKKPLQPIEDQSLKDEPILKVEPKPAPPVNPKTAVGDGKVMQDFEPESVPLGGDIPHVVKAPPNGTDSGSKDCITLPSPTAVFRVKEPSDKDGFAQIKRTLLRAAPAVRLIEEVPDDSAAKRVANAWKEKIPDAQVVLLACETDADTLELLKSLGKAIDQNLAKAKILPAEKMERENRWDLFLQKNQFRLIIASDGLQKLSHLMRFYKALPATSESYLDKTPLLALSPASVYKSLEAKAHLWKTLCQMLKK